MSASAWSAQQLAEFLAAVSSSESESAAALAAVERSAEALDAEVAALVAKDELVAAVGYPEGAVPVADLASVPPGTDDRKLVVPGVGACCAAAVSLEHPRGATLIVARSDGLTREEASLLRGMARVTSMTMRMLRLLDDAERLAQEQAALRHVATLVAGQAPADEIFAAVAEEVGRLIDADVGGVCRYEADDCITIVGSWSKGGSHPAVGMRLPLEGESVAAMVLRSGGPARVDDYEGLSGPIVELLTDRGARSTVGAPIVVDGRVWGAMMVSSNRPQPFAEDTESRIMDFTELVATAISNAASRIQLAASRARIVAAADEMRRRIERDLHDGIQQRLVSLTLELHAAGDGMHDDQREVREQLGRIEDGLKSLLDELREISRGVHPAILSEGGLGPAVKSLARRAPLPVVLHVGPVERLPEPVEVAAYYIVSEALANAAKHARASVAEVEADIRNGILHVAIRDDGVGGADAAVGSGILGLTDRVEVLGGTIAVTSPPGKGTSLAVTLPLQHTL